MCRAADAPAAGKQQPAAQPANVKADQAAKWVQQALQAEADGKSAECDTLLKQALAIAPDYAAAHWQRGEIKSNTGWVSIDEAAKHDAHSAKLDEYRQLRDQAGATADEQLNLARWCEKAGLKEQQRAHLLFALDLDPNNKEAIGKLGLVEYRGEMIPKAQLDDVRDRDRQLMTDSQEWKSRIYSWRQQLQNHPNSSHDDMLNNIRAIRDPAAIPSLEKELSNGGIAVGNAVIASLAAMTQQAATDALVRMALYSPYDEVRKGAAYDLRSRSMYSYVPVLVSALRAPIQVTDEVQNLSRLNSGLLLFQEGPTENRLESIENVVGHRGTHTQFMFLEQKMVTLKQVESLNENAAKFNTVLATVLETATGQQLGDEPSAWWNWWLDENEYYSPPEKPTEFTQIVRRADCFVAGTPVWTMTGPMQIENIKVGELVLAQNSETGEIAYKPVVGTFVRPISPLIQICLGEQIIRCAKGHPFWVDGIGWQMAKELKAGQWLHTAHGMVQIDSAEPSDEAVCFNLVVADFHDYFVSGAKLLVHDNLLRGPTLATVPGLAEAK
ncbi:MAG TPA: polymorphic toxin-type HINT domain-containing protein [Pirellulales bacterium]|jgi:hypothetical protein|nr:polymorphic toxin-type HINT domain-containing protein [Pirellulales bacterium]